MYFRIYNGKTIFVQIAAMTLGTIQGVLNTLGLYLEGRNEQGFLLK